MFLYKSFFIKLLKYAFIQNKKTLFYFYDFVNFVINLMQRYRQQIKKCQFSHKLKNSQKTYLLHVLFKKRPQIFRKHCFYSLKDFECWYF